MSTQLDRQDRTVGGKRRRLGFGEGVDADDFRLARFNGAQAQGIGLDQRLLHIAGLDRGNGAAQIVVALRYRDALPRGREAQGCSDGFGLRRVRAAAEVEREGPQQVRIPAQVRGGAAREQPRRGAVHAAGEGYAHRRIGRQFR